MSLVSTRQRDDDKGGSFCAARFLQVLVVHLFSFTTYYFYFFLPFFSLVFFLCPPSVRPSPSILSSKESEIEKDADVQRQKIIIVKLLTFEVQIDRTSSLFYSIFLKKYIRRLRMKCYYYTRVFSRNALLTFLQSTQKIWYSYVIYSRLRCLTYRRQTSCPSAWDKIESEACTLRFRTRSPSRLRFPRARINEEAFRTARHRLGRR